MTEQAMINVIDKIAEKLAVPTTEIVNAYAASGIMTFYFTIILFILAIIGIIIPFFVYKYDVYQNKNNRYDNSFTSTKVSIIIDIVLWIFAITNIPYVIFWFNNPKAYAIYEIINKLK